MVATLVALHLGLALIGQTPAQVTARLGRPAAIERYPVRRDLRYGRYEVIFGDGKRVSAFLARPAGRPAAVRAVLARVPGWHETRRYRCDPKGCFGVFVLSGNRRRVLYGLSRGKPYLGVQNE